MATSRPRTEGRECHECGMFVEAGEIHPFAACLMFKGCRDSTTVRANLNALAPTDAEREAMREVVEAARKAPDRLRRSIVFVTRSRRFAQELEQVSQEILRALARLDAVKEGRDDG